MLFILTKMPVLLGYVSPETRQGHIMTASWGDDCFNATDPDSRYPFLPAPAATTSEGWFLVYGLKNSSNDTRAGLRRGTTRKVQVWIRILPKSKVRGGPTVKRKPKGWYGLIEKKCFEQRRYLKHTWKKSIPGSGESQWKTIRWECAWIVQGLARRITMFKGQQARGRGVEDMGGQMVECSGGTT